MAKVHFVEKPPDGGWGWVIVASTFLLHVVVVGSTKSFGVFYAEFREVFQESAGITSFISSILGSAVLLFSNAQNLGVDKTPAAFLLSILGISEAVSRVLNGWLSDREIISKVYYYMVGLTGLAVCNIVIPFARSYAVLVVCAVLYGFFSGIFYALIAVLVRKYVGASRISCGLGWAFVFEGAAFLLGAPVAGWLYDATGKYDMSFYAAGIFIFLSVLVLVPISCSTDRWTRVPDQNRDETVSLDDMGKLSMFRHMIDDDDGSRIFETS
uniref:Major facilitator superfamily (MFS) profile domain-containing protein n=1 Tax=Branchiostoma floridae TaxID=7739 RepID=C3YBQ5_BRAFL|eukprot:XP_002606402.1 hypothetical protein BRAFLDRAFT_67653 [Branchiostoma floridae]